MRQRVKYEIVHAGTFKSSEKTLELAVEFANTLEPQQLITFNLTDEGKVVVWYRER
jgi:hypothetical protein